MIVVLGLMLLLATAVHVVSESNQPQCLESEKEALLSFKLVVQDPNDPIYSRTNISVDQNCCEWSYVTCDHQTNHVIAIDFSGPEQNVIGGVIGSSLLQLEYLSHLDLSGMNFSRIPRFMGSLEKLTYLNLGGNPISGIVPPQLGNLTKLEFLDLSSTSDQVIVGNLDWLSRLTSLRTFRLSGVTFTKEELQSIKWAPSLSTLFISNCLLPKVDTSSLSYANYSFKFLHSLQISQNSIHPATITWLLNSSVILDTLLLTNNIIDGYFPNSFVHKQFLEHVDLSGNKIASKVPKSLGNLTNLKHLDLSSNNISGTLHNLLENLTGSTRKSLKNLHLSFNQLGGSILEDFQKAFPSLIELYLDNNLLEGPFPNHLKIFPSLQFLNLDDNHFTGLLPDLSSMPNLTTFSASNNKFNGTSSDSIGELHSLEVLDVSSNSLVGDISNVLKLRCPRLNHLDLSHNSNASLKFISKYWVPSFQLTFIKLISCKLGPQFPSWLQTQTNVSVLDISNSGISGPIPNWFKNRTSNLVYLNMAQNNLSGTLPNLLIKEDYQVKVVDLSFNQFHGSIPSSLSIVSHLYLFNNKFTEFRLFLCKENEEYNSLYILDISHNHLSGKIPDCWGNFQQLSVLNLGYNKLSGEIPSSLNKAMLQTLQLRHNSLSGTLPSSLKNCSWLHVLDLGSNNLTGSIPSWIGEKLNKLVLLSLKSNKFDGSIPLNLCLLTKIQVLDLSSNELSGAIPSCIEEFTSMKQMGNQESTISSTPLVSYYHRTSFGSYNNIASITWKGVEYEYDKILGLLRVIDLSSNKLKGEIPIEVTHLIQLIQLNLSRNNLWGEIPSMIGNLTKLDSLDLSHNKISGEIPLSLAQINSLNCLDLSNNRLIGKIPTGTQLQSINASAYMKNLGLYGPPLSSSRSTDVPSFSTYDDDDDESNNEWCYIGIGVGYIIGFCGVCGNLLINASWRLAYFRMMYNLGDWLYVMITIKWALLRRKLAWH
ncbi:receptor-like protein EIX2 [Humulus lupulus]|uniref:receptor-like protein EIX2 n=1 Tax=Humulus lupulus TaxID=3486 RepID=UPI002B40E406|nr:receptor-like protein EIX2 [Humulus lupulus]